jgi:hypothetical protein
LSRDEFELIKQWSVSEKIDGTNIRIFYHFGGEYLPGRVRFGGKTDNAQIPTTLFEYLQDTFTPEKFGEAFPDARNDVGGPVAILFGEGYGEKINKGGRYMKGGKGVSFILFDVWVMGDEDYPDGWWLNRENVKDIAEKLGIASVPEFGPLSIDQIIHMVRNGWVSTQAMSNGGDEKLLAEGIVARTDPMLMFRDGHPLMFKLKYKDFNHLREESK